MFSQLKKLAMTFVLSTSLFSQTAGAFVLDGNYLNAEVNEATSKVYNRDHWMYLSLSPSVKTYGYAHTGQNDEEYFNFLFGKILQEAHAMAYELYEAENYEAYYSFLVLALSVPFHESGVRHFRTNTPQLKNRKRGCIDRPNEGKLLFTTAGGNYLVRDPQTKHRNFVRLFKDPTETSIPSCSSFSTDEPMIQLLSSGFQEDMGLFQLNFTHHPNPFLDKDIFDLTKTIRYGLGFLYKGYKKLLFTYQKYSCLKADSGHLDFYNLGRGLWGGKYNSGSFKKSCRFRDGKGFWAFNDYEFLKHYEQLILKGKSSYHKYLSGTEKAAFEDLINKYKSFIFRDYKVVASKLTIRNKPGFDGAKCGLIDTAKSGEVNLKVFEVTNGWARISPYNIKKSLKSCYKLLKDTVRYYNRHLYVKLEYKGKTLLEEIEKEENPVAIDEDRLTENLETVLNSEYFSENKEGLKRYQYYRVTASKLKIRPEMNTTTDHCGIFDKSKGIDRVEVLEISEDGNWAKVNIASDSKLIRKACRDRKDFYMYKTNYMKPITDFKVKTKSKRKLGARVFLRARKSALTTERLDKVTEYVVVNDKKTREGKWYLLESFNGHDQTWVSSSDVEIVR